jgi:3-isopropylmalate dehydratase small subunit
MYKPAKIAAAATGAKFSGCGSSLEKAANSINKAAVIKLVILIFSYYFSFSNFQKTIN